MKRLVFLFVIVIAILSIIHSISAIYDLWQKQYVLNESKKQLVKQQEESQKLKESLHNVSNEFFVEEEARNKLFLIKPGESTVFIDKGLLGQKSQKITPPETLSNWQQWWKLFFG